ncbi:hypothetical protein COLO4_29168 [Corchorus olitorius]|uniref:No apical meristem (NAM) protein n=1 Tax=Corchorus olitorius TaxID=93759 RepID=A0A1R3HFX2_9ROSI|nr:hypothetical protein COLO4_29168 [Corchorus olitorius]
MWHGHKSCKELRTWLVDCRALAKKIKNASSSSSSTPNIDNGACRECPNCGYRIDNSDVSPPWPGFPVGVKFDPSDAAILDHLAAKCGVGNSKEHAFLDVFIPTLEENHGICYTHPENLPGALMDGSSIYFFHRTMNAYATGQRKRRKIQHNSNEEHVRWHKTGKSKSIIENGVHKGWKKIMVLYRCSKRNSKPEKTNWVMHQYHLGAYEEEQDGGYVVSKITYQPQKQADKNDGSTLIEEPENLTLQTSPRTPKTTPPNPPRPCKSMTDDDESMHQEAEDSAEASLALPHAVDDSKGKNWLAGESQAAENPRLDCLDYSSLCNDIIHISPPQKNEYNGCVDIKNEVTFNNDASYGIPELENLDFDTPPDFHLAGNKRVCVRSRNVGSLKDATPTLVSTNVIQLDACFEDNVGSFSSLTNPFNGWCRMMSTSRGRSMRSKVERRMQKESGKTAREIRRAKKIKKKLMTDEERLIYNLKRAKKKVALLLQKLKKYELPELPPSVHDPELFTLEQLQAYKKIGFRNKNYVPVGVRGVFGGVVQNMHLHWKFHETVQVCCDNFPKEKIKEMATMLARLSGGIVINIHNALFKARFEQALEAQKLNIKKIEQELRRKGINPEDPVAMASIQRVASTFFNAIDEKEGSPYVFRGDQSSVAEPRKTSAEAEAPAESDEEELDKFIAEIEDAADREWAAGEEQEKEEIGRIRYFNRQEFGGRTGRLDDFRNNYSYDEVRGSRGWKDMRGNKRIADSEDEYEDDIVRAAELDSPYAGGLSESENDDDSEEAFEFKRSRVENRKQYKIGRWNNSNNSLGFRQNAGGFRRSAGGSNKQQKAEEDSDVEDLLSDLDNAMRESDAEEEYDFRGHSNASENFRSSSDEEDGFYSTKGSEKNNSRCYESDDSYDTPKDGLSRNTTKKAEDVFSD